MRLLPKQDKFYEMFGEFAGLLERAAAELQDGFRRGESALSSTAARLLAFEQEADALGMQLFNTLHKSFVTPFDPEDMYALIHHLDDIMDGMEDIAHRAEAYRLKPIPETMRLLAGIIFEATKGVSAAIRALQKNKEVILACIALKTHEAEVDKLTRTAIAKLFAEERDAIALLKQKEVYEFFEATADACAQVATIIGRIHIKGG